MNIGISKPAEIPQTDREALDRLMAHALAGTGQSERVAQFLLAWWNADEFGGFDLTHLWGLDVNILTDMTTVFGLIARVSKYPDVLGYEEQFQALIRMWRPTGA